MKSILLKALIAVVAVLACHTATAQTDSVIHDTITHRYERFYYYSYCIRFSDLVWVGAGF